MYFYMHMFVHRYLSLCIYIYIYIYRCCVHMQIFACRCIHMHTTSCEPQRVPVGLPTGSQPSWPLRPHLLQKTGSLAGTAGSRGRRELQQTPHSWHVDGAHSFFSFRIGDGDIPTFWFLLYAVSKVGPSIAAA